MTNKNSINSNIIIIAAAIIALLLLYLNVSKFLHMQDTKTAIQNEEQILQDNEIKLKKLQNLAKQEEEFREGIALMEKLIPTGAHESDLIIQLSASKAHDQIDFLKIEFKDRVVNNNVSTLPISLSYSGKYFGLVQLLADIHHGDRLIRIDDINITKKDGPGNKIEATIAARAFSR